jgi:TRAP-type C4-dicarboxylate transport system permease small subunit
LIAEALAVALLAVLVFITSLGVADRFLLGLGLAWTEELARYLLLWASFLAAIVATRRSAHFKVEFLAEQLGPAYARGIILFSIAVCLVAAWYGVQFAWFFRKQISPALGISMGWVYASVPAGFVGMAFYLFRDLFRSRGASSEGGDVR